MLSFSFLLCSGLLNASLPAYAISDIPSQTPFIISEQPQVQVKESRVNKKYNISIGILSQTPQNSIKNTPWQYTFERLNNHPKYHFSARFLDAKQIRSALDVDELDFIITDAINYILLEKKYGLLRLLSRTVQYGDQYVTTEGLSVYTLNDNSDITRLQDLKNKNLGIVNDHSSLSWLFLEKFLANNGLINNTNIQLKRIENINQALAQLYAGSFDAIVAKSGILENTFSHESLEQLRLINPRRGWQAPFLHSSVLIPEWPLAKAWFTDNQTAREVVSLLLNQQRNNHNIIGILRKIIIPSMRYFLLKKNPVIATSAKIMTPHAKCNIGSASLLSVF